MKRNAIVRIILFSIAIVILLGILVIGIAVKHYMFDDEYYGEYTTSSVGTADAASVRNIRIVWAAGSITVRPADVKQISFTETMPDGEAPMAWYLDGDTLKLSYAEPHGKLDFGNTISKHLVIEAPRDWSCETLKIETASADLNVEYMTIGKVDFDGASGEFNFHECSVDTIDMDTAFGDMLFCGTLNTLEADAASADIEIILNNCPRRIDMDTASGDLDLTLPEGSSFDVRLESLSGNLDTDFKVDRTGDGFICGSGDCRIDISALSGDVYIRKGTEAKNCDH